jgi:plasmid maintenance system antidote protein VapI
MISQLYQNQERKIMSQQHKKWIQIVKDKLNEENMTQTHLARACGVKRPTISELLKYGKGSDKLKNRVCDVLHIEASWVDLEEE